MTVSPGWYDDGVTPGVLRWFDGRAWTETTRPSTPAGPPAAARPAPAVQPPGPARGVGPWTGAAADASTPPGVPTQPGPTSPLVQRNGAVYGGGRYADFMPNDRGPGPTPGAPAYPGEPWQATSATAAGYPSNGTPYRASEAAAPAAFGAGTAAASPYPGATASPYTGATTSPSLPAGAYAPAGAGYGAGASPAVDQPASWYPSGGYPMTGVAGGYPMAGGMPGGLGRTPGTGTFGSAPPDALERMYRGQGSAQADEQRQSASVQAGIGIVLLIAAGALLRLTATSGTGRVWTWGFLAGAVLLVRGAWSYVKSVRAGAPHFGPVGWAAVGAGVVAAVAMVVTSVQSVFAPMPVEVGSCFTDEGPEVQQVECSDPHDYVVAAVVGTIGACPSYTTVYTRVDGDVACLTEPGMALGD